MNDRIISARNALTFFASLSILVYSSLLITTVFQNGNSSVTFNHFVEEVFQDEDDAPRRMVSSYAKLKKASKQATATAASSRYMEDKISKGVFDGSQKLSACRSLSGGLTYIILYGVYRI